jgi:Tfp pilus assembly protein PilO
VTGKRIALAGLGVAVLLTIAWFFLLYQPAVDEQAALEVETQALLGQQQQLRNQISMLENIRAREDEINDALARLDAFIPVGTAQPEILTQIDAAAQAAGVEILTWTFGEPTPVLDAPATGEPTLVLGELILTMTVEGGYFQAVDFFRRLEFEVPRAILVETVAVAEGEGGFPVLATTWSGRTFALVPPPPALPGAEGSVPVAPATPPATPLPAPTGTPVPETPAAGSGVPLETTEGVQ